MSRAVLDGRARLTVSFAKGSNELGNGIVSEGTEGQTRGRRTFEYDVHHSTTQERRRGTLSSRGAAAG